MLRNLVATNWDYFGPPDVGVLGSNIPQTGESGGSVMANDIQLPADANNFYRAVAVTPPTGTFQMEIDGSGTFTGAAGSHTLIYRVYENGIDRGTTTATFEFGTTHAEISDIPMAMGVAADETWALSYSESATVSMSMTPTGDETFVAVVYSEQATVPMITLIRADETHDSPIFAQEEAEVLMTVTPTANETFTAPAYQEESRVVMTLTPQGDETASGTGYWLEVEKVSGVWTEESDVTATWTEEPDPDI